jgi:hypothetical protein
VVHLQHCRTAAAGLEGSAAVSMGPCRLLVFQSG